MNFLQKTILVTTNIIDLQTQMDEIIKTNAKIDMVVPNTMGKKGWLIVYTPNTLIT